MNFPNLSLELISPIFLGVIAISLIILLILNFKDKEILKELKEIRKDILVVIFLVFLLGFYLRAFYMPHRFIADDLAYIKTAEGISKTGRAQICGYSGYDTLSCDKMNKIFVYPFLLAIIFYLFGISTDLAFNLNILLGSLSIFLIFLVSYFLFNKNERIGIYSALLFSLFPFFIRNSITAETEASSIFFILFALLCFLLYFRIDNFKMQMLALISLTFAVWTRFENIMLLPLFILFLILEQNFKFKIKDFKFLVPWLICGIFFISIFIQNVENYKFNVFAAVQYDKISEVFRYDELKANIVKYGENILNGKLHPPILNLFIIIGILHFWGYSRSCFLMLNWFFCFFILYMSMFETVIDLYLLPPYLGLIFFGGYGTSKILDRIKEIKYSHAFSLSLVIVTSLSFYPHIQNIYLEKPGRLILETKIPELVEKEISKDCYIVTKFPTILMATTDLKAIMTEHIIQNPEIITEILNKKICLLYFEDMYSLFVFREENEKIHDRYNLTSIFGYKSDDRKAEYKFYKIKSKI
ncbi:MAG: glycosyltransferase family 39 protein [Candidatus Aenigmatarchaeota archaeon]